MTHPDVLIVGGGVIGLASAYAMARGGLAVTVLDAGELGGESSRAAAGILGPLAESHADSPFTELLWHGLMRFPAFVEALREDAAADPELDLTGILTLITDEDADLYRASLGWRRRYEPTLALEPATLAGFAWAAWSPREGQVYGPHYLAALAEACRARGVRLTHGQEALRLLVQDGRVTGVETPAGPIVAGLTVVAAGVWTDRVLASVGVRTGVRPIRGQVLAVRAPNAFAHVRYTAAGYAAPKRNGVVIIGATEDEAGFDSRVSLGGLTRLGRKAEVLAPDLGDGAFERAWAGLRPKTADGLPVVGSWPDLPGLMVATGHYRNGILLSAITAEWTAALATGSPLPLPDLMTPLGPDRLRGRSDSPDEA